MNDLTGIIQIDADRSLEVPAMGDIKTYQARDGAG